MNFAPYALHMSCDHTGHTCLREVRRAPRIVVPSVAPARDPRRGKVMTTLHYCDKHAWDFNPASYWSDFQKRRFEVAVRQKWDVPFRPDFERSFIEMVLVTTPEYQAFLWRVGQRLRAA